MASIHYYLLTQTQTEIQALIAGGTVLTRYMNGDVILLDTPTDDESVVDTFPSILVAPFGAEEVDREQSTNIADQIIYPILVAILDDANEVYRTNLEARLEEREQLYDFFIHNRTEYQAGMPNSARLLDIDVTPRDVIEPEAWFDNNLFVSSFELEFTVMRPRRP